MFGNNIVPPKYVKRERVKMPHDILLPGSTPGYYQHIARQPNTDYHVRYLHYKQSKDSNYNEKIEKQKKTFHEEAFLVKYDGSVLNKRLHREINDRVQKKLEAYEQTIEERRKRLQELLCQEEHEYFYETVDNAQKGRELKMEEQKIRAQQLKAQREADRLEIVKQKRKEQYRERCQELRPILVHKRLLESKRTQMQQMRENEARREAERELDQMWHNLAEKQRQTLIEREKQDLLKEAMKNKDLLAVRAKQIRGKELLKAEMEALDKEDRLEMQKLSEKLRREEIQALDEKRRKRDQRAQELMEQMAIQEELLARRKKEENALDEAFALLTKLEIDREKSAIQDSSNQARRETAMYRKHLKELEEERKKEEKELNELLEFHRKETIKKQDEAKCKVIEAKRKLQCDVLNERAKQLEYKKLEAEQQLKFKEAENELLRMAFETNERLQAEHDRHQALAKHQHRADLEKQIEYNKLLKQREQDELERQLLLGLKEEEEYKKVVEELMRNAEDITGKHPFRRVLERHNCYCPTK